MSLSSITGQERAISVLGRALESGRMAHAYIFVGPAGVGKMAAALEFAKALVCEAGGADSCEKCAHCLKAAHGLHPDIHVLTPEGAGRMIKIDAVRERVQNELALKPNEARRKAVVIDDAHAMNIEAANCLLKTLEEPPGDAVLVLVTPRPDALPETIISRCQMVRFRPLEPQVIAALLVQRGTDNSTADFLSQLAGGSLGRAIELAEKPALADVRAQLLELLTQLNEANVQESAGRFLKLAAELSDTPAERRTATEWLFDLAELFYRDVAVFQVGVADSQIANRDVVPLIERESVINPYGIRAILDTIEQAKQYVKSNVDVDMVVTVAFSRIAALRIQRAA